MFSNDLLRCSSTTPTSLEGQGHVAHVAARDLPPPRPRPERSARYRKYSSQNPGSILVKNHPLVITPPTPFFAAARDQNM